MATMYHGSDRQITEIYSDGEAGTGMGIYLTPYPAAAKAYGPVVNVIEIDDNARIAGKDDLADAVEATRWIDEDAGIAAFDPDDYATWELLHLIEVRDWLANRGFDGVAFVDIDPDGDDHEAVLVWNTSLLRILAPLA